MAKGKGKGNPALFGGAFDVMRCCRRVRCICEPVGDALTGEGNPAAALPDNLARRVFGAKARG